MREEWDNCGNDFWLQLEKLGSGKILAVYRCYNVPTLFTNSTRGILNMQWNWHSPNYCTHNIKMIHCQDFCILISIEKASTNCSLGPSFKIIFVSLTVGLVSWSFSFFSNKYLFYIKQLFWLISLSNCLSVSNNDDARKFQKKYKKSKMVTVISGSLFCVEKKKLVWKIQKKTLVW